MASEMISRALFSASVARLLLNFHDLDRFFVDKLVFQVGQQEFLGLLNREAGYAPSTSNWLFLTLSASARRSSACLYLFEMVSSFFSRCSSFLSSVSSFAEFSAPGAVPPCAARSFLFPIRFSDDEFRPCLPGWLPPFLASPALRASATIRSLASSSAEPRVASAIFFL